MVATRPALAIACVCFRPDADESVWGCVVLQLDRELPASLQREIGRANNVNASAFDPHAFSLAEAEERVRGACAGKASVAGGELQYNMPLFGSQTVDLSGGLRQGKGIRVEQTAGSVVGAQSVRVPEARDPRGLRVCGPCGSPNGLKLCSACKTVAYCSAACQVHLRPSLDTHAARLLHVVFSRLDGGHWRPVTQLSVWNTEGGLESAQGAVSCCAGKEGSQEVTSWCSLMPS